MFRIYTRKGNQKRLIEGRGGCESECVLTWEIPIAGAQVFAAAAWQQTARSTRQDTLRTQVQVPLPRAFLARDASCRVRLPVEVNCSTGSGADADAETPIESGLRRQDGDGRWIGLQIATLRYGRGIRVVRMARKGATGRGMSRAPQ